MRKRRMDEMNAIFEKLPDKEQERLIAYSRLILKAVLVASPPPPLKLVVGGRSR